MSLSYIILTAAAWAIFFCAVRPREWHRYYPQRLFGALLGTLFDLIGVVTFQWHYLGPTTGGLSLWSDLGVAPAEAGLFTWSLRRLGRWPGAVWAFWILGNTLGELVFMRRGWIVYGHWRPLKALVFYVVYFLCLRMHLILLDWLEGRM